MALSVVERRNNIIELLNEAGKVSVKELSVRFDVSEVAIRTDLTELEKQGLLTRVHGGAITSYKSYYDMSLVQRSNTNPREKMGIAKQIGQMVHDNDTLIMNAGTTPLFVMRELSDKKVTIVTNSIALALEGAKNANFKIILLGGDVDTNYQFTYGTATIGLLQQYNADMAILSVDGVDPVNGVSTFYHQEAEVCKCMMAHAKKTIVAADYSKIGRSAFVKIEDVSKVDILVTSENADGVVLSKLRKKGIRVVAAKS